MLLLIFNTVVWGLLSWYANNVRGDGALPYHFPFTASYWGCARGRGVVHEASDADTLVEVSALRKVVVVGGVRRWRVRACVCVCVCIYVV